MNDFDYLNARVRGMSTALLPREFYEQVLSASSDTMLVDALLASPYAPDLREELARPGVSALPHAVEAALKKNAHATFARVLSAAPPEPRRLLALQLNRWDVSNVVAVLRGRLAGAGPRESLDAVLPIGELDESQWGELAAEADIESVAECLTTWKHAIGFALRRAIRECGPRGEARLLEQCLYRAYFSWTLAQLAVGNPQHETVRGCIQRHIDLLNVLTILTLVDERARGIPVPEQREAPIAAGSIPDKVLQRLFESAALEAAFEILTDTYFAPGVEKGILTYGQARSLAAMERFLETVVIEQGCRLFRQDVLSIAVPLGFIWRKYSEVCNLRMLARGAAYGMSPHAVRLELLLA